MDTLPLTTTSNSPVANEQFNALFVYLSVSGVELRFCIFCSKESICNDVLSFNLNTTSLLNITIASPLVDVVKDKLLVVTTAPKLVGRSGELFRRQNIFSTRKLEDDETKAFASILNATQQQNSNVKFVVFDKKVVGVKIN